MSEAVDASAAARLRGLLLLAIVVGTINGLSRVAMPLFAASLGAHPWQMGVVGGLGYAGVLLMALPMGAWIDRHGSRPLFVRGVAAAALMYLLLPLVAQPAHAVLAAGVLGLVLPFRTVPAHTEFLALLPQLSAAKAGWNRAAHTLGMFFLGPTLSAATIAALGFASVFRLAAVGLLVAGLLGQRVLTSRSRPELAGQQGHDELDESLARRIGRQLRLLAAHADLRRTMAIDLVTQMSVAYFVVFGVVLAVRQFGLPLQAAAGLVTVQGAGYVLTLYGGGQVFERWTEDARYTLAFGLLLLQALLFGLGPAPWALWLGASLMGVGVGLQGLASTTRFADLMRQYGRGQVGGLTSLGPPAGGVIGAMAGGLVSQRLGLQSGFLILAVAYALLAIDQARRHRVRAGGEPG
jgi:MFS family permease